MLPLLLIWLVAGLLIGAVAVAARLAPPRWQRWRWLALPALGAVVALVGGWLGALLLDHLFASFVAVWLSVAVVGAAALLARHRVV
jgi:uncharacterized membrane protein YeaQ/YmgE (transglycosylase-associated protein family)